MLPLFFLAQYHCRMAFLTLRYKSTLIFKRHSVENEQTSGAMRALNPQASESAQFTDKHLTSVFHFLKEKTVENEQLTGAMRAIKAKTVENEQLTETMRTLKAKTIENEQITGALRVIKQTAESERLHTALQTTKKRLIEMVIVEETPEEQATSYTREKLKNAWQTLETAKIPRIPHGTLKNARHSSETDKLPRVTPETPTEASQSPTSEKQPRLASGMQKNAWQMLKTGKLPRLAPETFTATRHPLKTLKEARHDRAALISLGLTALIVVVLFTLGGLAGNTLHAIQTFDPTDLSQLAGSELNIVAQQAPAFNASKALVRLSQLNEDEYASQDEYDTWAYSACSTASMTEVFDAYGRHYRITDVLKVENAIGAITPQLGLLHDSDVAKTAAQFGFHTYWGENWTLDQVLSYANAGEPVIVGWPPDRYPEGHIVVVTGGNAHAVDLADSSLWDRQTLSRTRFMKWWGGFAAVVTPE